MNAKTVLSQACTLVFITIALLSTTSCNDKEDNSLKVLDAEHNSVTLYYPNDNLACITIDGGVRPYSVSCQSEILKVNMDKWPNAFNYEVLGTGEAKVKVSDASGQSVWLDVVIRYREQDFKIAKQDVLIKGDQMTVAAQKELGEKVLASIPVKPGGGYKFIYTESESGTVHIFTEKFGDKYKEGSFEMSYYKDEENESIRFPIYTIRLDKEEHPLFIYKYNAGLRSSERIPLALYEDLTEKYKTEYPEMESVYSMQVIDTE